VFKKTIQKFNAAILFLKAQAVNQINKIKSEGIRKVLLRTAEAISASAKVIAVTLLIVIGYKALVAVIPTILAGLAVVAGTILLYWVLFGIKEVAEEQPASPASEAA
jgi:flagellar basal body-associated protein FliL